MYNFKTIQIIAFSLIFLSCGTGKFLKNEDQALILEAKAQQMIRCLNEGNEACLSSLYAEDFSSLSPLMSTGSKVEIVGRTVESYRSNQLYCQAGIVEVYCSEGLGYVVMDWQLLKKQEAGNDEILIDQKRLDLWQRNKNLGWQLKRTVFYDPKSF